jgi:heavy metal sensor kinase
MTIRARLTLWYVALLALTILAFSLFLYYELQDILSRQIDAGIQVSASQLMVDVDDSVNPPMLRPMSEEAASHILQSSFASRMVTASGEVVADVGGFPDLAFSPPDAAGFETIVISGVEWRIFTQQVQTDAQEFDVWLQVGQSLNVIHETQNSLFQLILIAFPLVLLLTALGGIFMANRALNPVAVISKTMQAIHASDMSQRIPNEGANDELSRLRDTLNAMLDRLQNAFERERRFTADASHELRTPLTVIKGQIGVTLSRPRQAEEYQTALNALQSETDRLIRLANDLLLLARLDAEPELQAETVNLSDLLEAVLDQVRFLAEQKNITISATIPEGVLMQGMIDHLIRLFLNLLDNAVKYSPEGSKINLSLEASNDFLIVTIQDEGQGIPPEDLPHLFERFYRAGRERSSGAGLGLAIAQQILRLHSGSIQIDSVLQKGTKVIVSLPQK